MKQLQKPDAPVSTKVRLGMIDSAFIRRPGHGEIYYAAKRGGDRTTYVFPVWENGQISRTSGSESPHNPDEQVETIWMKDLGIEKLVWAD